MRRHLRTLAALALAVGAGVASAQAVPACSPGQKPYAVDWSTGDTPDQACLNLGQLQWTVVMHSPSACQVKEQSSGTNYYFEVKKVCEPSEPHWSLERNATEFFELTPQDVEDYLTMFSAMMLAGIAVLAAKSIYNRFRVDHDPA